MVLGSLVAGTLGALTTPSDRERTECERPATGEARIDVRFARSHDSPNFVVDITVRVPADDPLVAAWRRTGPATPYLLECVLGAEVRRPAAHHGVETAGGQAKLSTEIEVLGRHLPWNLGPLTFEAATEGIVVRASEDCDAAEPNKHRGCGVGLLNEVAVVATDVAVVHAVPAPHTESTEDRDGSTVHTLLWSSTGVDLERVVVDLGVGRNLGAWLPTVLRSTFGDRIDDGWAVAVDLNTLADKLDVLMILLVVALVVRRVVPSFSDSAWALLFGVAALLLPIGLTVVIGPARYGPVQLYALGLAMAALSFRLLRSEPPLLAFLGTAVLLAVPWTVGASVGSRLAAYAVVLGFAAVAVWSLACFLWDMQAVVPRLPRLSTARLGPPLVAAGCCAAAYLLGYTTAGLPTAREVGVFFTAASLLYFLAEWALPAAAALLILATRSDGRHPAPDTSLPAACLLFAVAAGPTGVRVLDTFAAPVQLALAVVLFLVVRKRRPGARPALSRPALLDAACRLEVAHRQADELDRRADGSAARPADAEAARRAVTRLERAAPGGTDPGAVLLAWGPARGWWQNGRRAAAIGAVLAILPVGYFVGAGLAVLPQNLRFGGGPVHLLVSACAEGVRWLGTAFAFGALYPVLPGRIGPAKALSLGTMWFVAAGVVEIVRHWTDFATGRNWGYPGLVLVVFLLVLSVLYDVHTVTRAGGTWRRLQDLYRIRRSSDLLRYVVPFGLALVGVVQQLLAGNGFELVKQVLSALAPTPAP